MLFLVWLDQGTVKLVFQPAEESHAGGYHVLQEGVLDDVDAIFAVHIDTHLPMGTVGSRPGPFLAGSARFKATITGKGGHGAVPHAAVDPVVAASSVVLSLQQLVAREIDPLQSAVHLTFAIRQVIVFIFRSSFDYLATLLVDPTTRKFLLRSMEKSIFIWMGCTCTFSLDL